MPKSKKCSLRVLSDDNKTLYGTAAQLHYISEQGGWDAFMKKVTSESAEIAVQHAFKEMEKARFKPVRKNRKVS